MHLQESAVKGMYLPDFTVSWQDECYTHTHIKKNKEKRRNGRNMVPSSMQTDAIFSLRGMLPHKSVGIQFQSQCICQHQTHFLLTTIYSSMCVCVWELSHTTNHNGKSITLASCGESYSQPAQGQEIKYETQYRTLDGQYFMDYRSHSETTVTVLWKFVPPLAETCAGHGYGGRTQQINS